MQTNPFQPSSFRDEKHPQSSTDGVRFDFEGDLEIQDIKPFVPLPGFSILGVLLVSLCLLFIAGSISICAQSLQGKKLKGDAYILGSISFGLVPITCFTLLFLSAGGRARRFLRQFPRIIGQRTGTIDSNGIQFIEDGIHHWLHWKLMPNVRISKRGFSFQRSIHPYDLYVVPARMFHSFDIPGIKTMWEAATKNEIKQELTALPEFAYGPAGIMPSDSIHFQGTIELDVPRVTSFDERTWSVLTITILAWFASIFVGIPWLLWAMTIPIFICLAWGTVRARRQGKTIRTKLLQWGWVNPKNLLFGYGFTARILQMQKLQVIQIDESAVWFQYQQERFLIHSVHVGKAEDFRRLQELFRNLIS